MRKKFQLKLEMDNDVDWLNITKLSQFLNHMKNFPQCSKVLTSLEIFSFLYDESILNDWEYTFYTSIIRSGKRKFSYKQTDKIIKINNVIYQFFRKQLS